MRIVECLKLPLPSSPFAVESLFDTCLCMQPVSHVDDVVECACVEHVSIVSSVAMQSVLYS